jgi:integrase
MSRKGKRGRAATCFYYHGQRSYRIYPRNDNGRWYADYMEDGKRVRQALKATTRPEAEAAVKELDKGPEPTKQETEEKVTTLADASAEFLRHCADRELAPRSVARYKAAMDAFGRFCRANGVAQLNQVRLKTLEDFRAYRTSTEKMDPRTAYTDGLVLKGFFKFAAHPARGLLAANPAAAWELRKPVKPQAYCFTTEEAEKLLAGCREWLRPILTTLAFTGMRIGELINLKRKDVDFEQGVIRVRIRADWTPKGRRDRTIPMHPRVRQAMSALKPDDFFFTGPHGGRVKENYTLDCFKADRDKLGIKQGTLHTFRHFFVSLCASSGKVPLSTCMSWVGHRDAAMVWHYYHLSESASREAMARLAGAGA